MPTKSLLHVLIIENQILVIEAYRAALSKIASQNKNIIFCIDVAKDCDTANSKISRKLKNGESYSLAMLEVKLLPIENESIFSGEELCIKVKELFKEVTLFIFTMLNDKYCLYNILKNIEPDVLILKSCTSSKELIEAIESVLNNSTFYSDEIIRLMRQNISIKFSLDQYDRQILYFLSRGMKTKKLPDYIPLSLPAIIKRKANLKDMLNVSSKDDWDLLIEAQLRGII